MLHATWLMLHGAWLMLHGVWLLLHALPASAGFCCTHRLSRYTAQSPRTAMTNRRQFLKASLAGFATASAFMWPGPALAQRPAFARMALARLAFDLSEPHRLTSSEQRIVSFIEEARLSGAEVVVFPELALGGLRYSNGGHSDAWWTSPLTAQDYLAALETLRRAAQSAGIDVFFGGVEFSEGRLYNSVFLASRSGHLNPVARKGVYSDNILGSEYFSAGRLPTEEDLVTIAGRRTLAVVCANILAEPLLQRIDTFAPEMVVVLANWWDDPNAPSPLLTNTVERLSLHGRTVLLSNFLVPGGCTPLLAMTDGKLLKVDTRQEEGLLLVELPFRATH